MLPSKFQKWRNRTYNWCLSIRFWLRWHIIGWPSVERGYKKIQKKGYGNKHKIAFTEFMPFPESLTNYGTARPDVDSVFKQRCSELHIDYAYFDIINKTAKGYGWEKILPNGTKIPPKKEPRPTIAGLSNLEPVELTEMYSIEMDFDDNALGEWPAWWFLMTNAEGETGYYELDMMEKFYGKKSERNLLTTSIHFSETTKDKGMMHNMSYRVKRFRIIHQAVEFCKNGKTKIYINGSLVWVDWLFPCWCTKGKNIVMTLGTGLMKDAYHGETKERLEKNKFTFGTKELCHHSKTNNYAKKTNHTYINRTSRTSNYWRRILTRTS